MSHPTPQRLTLEIHHAPGVIVVSVASLEEADAILRKPRFDHIEDAYIGGGDPGGEDFAVLWKYEIPKNGGLIRTDGLSRRVVVVQPDERCGGCGSLDGVRRSPVGDLRCSACVRNDGACSDCWEQAEDCTCPAPAPARITADEALDRIADILAGSNVADDIEAVLVLTGRTVPDPMQFDDSDPA